MEIKELEKLPLRMLALENTVRMMRLTMGAVCEELKALREGRPIFNEPPAGRAHGAEWTPEQDAKLLMARNEFIMQQAVRMGRSENAIRARLRKFNKEYRDHMRGAL